MSVSLASHLAQAQSRLTDDRLGPAKLCLTLPTCHMFPGSPGDAQICCTTAVAKPHGKTPCLQGADPSATNDQEQTPLYKAVEAKQAVATQALCQFGPGAVNQADEWGLCPLHIAARAGNADIVTLLLLAQVRAPTAACYLSAHDACTAELFN